MDGLSRRVSFEIFMDFSEGKCGVTHPDNPEIKCEFPNKLGESFHIMTGGHQGRDPEGVTHGWRQESSPEA